MIICASALSHTHTYTHNGRLETLNSSSRILQSATDLRWSDIANNILPGNISDCPGSYGGWGAIVESPQFLSQL